MSLIKHILSAIHSTINYTICGTVCFQFTHTPRDDWENIWTLSYYHHQIGSMNYYPLFKVRSWNNCMRCMSFYILAFPNWFCRMKIYIFRLRFYCSLFLGVQLTVSQHYFRQWLGADQGTNILSEPTMAKFTDIYMRHSASMTYQRR